MKRFVVTVVVALGLTFAIGASQASPLCDLEVCDTLCHKNIVC